MASVMPFPVSSTRHGDKSHKVIGNADILPPFATALVRRFNVDRLHKLPQRAI